MIDLSEYGKLTQYKFQLARELAGYTRKGLSNEKSFQEILGRKISATEIHDTETKRSIKSIKVREYLNAFCKFICISESEFVKTEDTDEFIKIIKKQLKLNKLKTNQMKRKMIHSSAKKMISDTLLAKGEILILNIVNKSDFKIFQCLELATKLIETKKVEHMDMAVRLYEKLVQIEEYYKEAFEHILASIGYLAYKKKNISEERDENNKPNEKIAYHVKNYCGRMIRLLGKYNEFYQFGGKIYLANLDLSYLDFSGESKKDRIKDLSTAWFNKSNIANSDFTGIDLSYANFDGIDCSKNACFKETILDGATFRKSNLRGVNMAPEPIKGSNFLAGMSQEDAGRPFLEAKTMSGAKIDEWLEEFLINEKKEYLLR